VAEIKKAIIVEITPMKNGNDTPPAKINGTSGSGGIKIAKLTRNI